MYICAFSWTPVRFQPMLLVKFIVIALLLYRFPLFIFFLGSQNDPVKVLRQDQQMPMLSLFAAANDYIAKPTIKVVQMIMKSMCSSTEYTVKCVAQKPFHTSYRAKAVHLNTLMNKNFIKRRSVYRYKNLVFLLPVACIRNALLSVVGYISQL